MISLRYLLNQLKITFQPYSGLWEDWCKYKICKLSEQQKHLIEIHRENNFKVSAEHLLMFYNHEKELRNALKKLNKTYPEFKEWAVAKFEFAILDLTVIEDIDNFFATDIEYLNINNELKNVLQGFNKKNLREIFDTYSDKDFESGHTFKIVLEVLNVMYQKKEIINPQKINLFMAENEMKQQ